MPFGLKNVPYFNSRCSKSCQPGDRPSFVAAYVYYSNIFSLFAAHLHKVIHKLRQIGLKVNPGKFQFIRREVEYLGHVITPNGLKPISNLVEAVSDYSLCSS